MALTSTGRLLFLSSLCIGSGRKRRAGAIGVFFDSSAPSCGRRSRPLTPLPLPTPHEAWEFRWARACLLSTLLRILPEDSRVRRLRRTRDEGGGVCWLPLPLCAAS